jgi:hypothetical protein
VIGFSADYCSTDYRLPLTDYRDHISIIDPQSSMIPTMCMLAIFFRTIGDCPVLLAANREEFFDRPGTEPQIWPGDPSFVAGRDPRGGGTWLGVNQHGVLVAVTNRPTRRQPADPRSRGLLCCDLLAGRTAHVAHDRALDELDRREYAGCNLLAADATGAYVVQSGESLRSCPLSPGIHVVTAKGLNETTDARTAYALAQLTRFRCRHANDWLVRLPRVLGDHGDSDGLPICLHAADRGTVSSSIVALPDDLNQAQWLHAQGPPCRTSFADYSQLFTQLTIPHDSSRAATCRG